MPYIITTSRRVEYGVNHDQRSDPTRTVITRRAVATLDEAREAAFAADDFFGDVRDADEIPENGGTIGPLPDGTVIEVRAAEWADLPPIAEARKRYPHGPARDAAIHAYNAEQS